MNKKKIFILFAILVIGAALSACGDKEKDSNSDTKDDNDGRGQVSEQEEMKKIPEFSSKDIEGNAVDNSIFKNNKITLVNVWATWCGPCLNELPGLQKVYAELKDKGVGVVGIIADGNESKDAAKEVISSEKITFPMLLPDDKLKDELISRLKGFPTSYIVDRNGKILDMHLGGLDAKGFKSFIEKYM